MFSWFQSAPRAVQPSEAQRLLDAGEIRLVDVREENEWRQGHVAGAIHLPLSGLARSLPEFSAGKPVVFYCRSGMRSGKAVALARSLKLGHDSHVAGGIEAWVRAGLPVVP
jgi:rhodanese-related sulfurtransferase